MPEDTSGLPTASFVELAFVLKTIANQQQLACSVLEVEIARQATPAALFVTGLHEARRSARAAGDAYRLLTTLAEREAEIRALVEKMSGEASDATSGNA